jgi:AcrR family transcriptional regulator
MRKAAVASRGRGAGKPPGTLTAEAWTRAALDLIRRDGVQAVAVEPLAKALGVTKGSFYWHFANRDELVAAALAAWEQDQSDDVVSRWEGVPEPRRRLRVMMFAAFEDVENGLLHASLAASSEDPRVQPVLRRITENRMALGVRSFMALGLPEDEARRRALFTYSAYAGYFDLMRAMPDAVRRVADLSAYVRYLADALLPEGLGTAAQPRGGTPRTQR